MLECAAWRKKELVIIKKGEARLLFENLKNYASLTWKII